MGKLTTEQIAKLSEPGMYGDGDGLYLQITGPNSKSWIFRYQFRSKARALGLGSLRDVTLARARIKRDKARVQVRDGVDIVGERRKAIMVEQLATQRIQPFENYAQRYITERRPSWSNEKHADQWENTLRAYAYPTIGHLSVADVTTAHVLELLRPIWTEKSETANRVRGRIESILDAAKAEGLRSGDNPARWRGHLQHILPSPTKLRPAGKALEDKHHPALPYKNIPDFFASLRKRESITALALEFLILTATRTKEAVAIKLSEVDFENAVWTIPASRMKARREHRVPLSPRCLEIIRFLSDEDGNPYVFPGLQEGQPIGEAAMAKLLKTMAWPSTTPGRVATPHGMRSTFRDWVEECTNFPSNVAETALAHTINSKTEAAYRRGDNLEKRRKLMEAWACYCADGTGADVIPLASARVADLKQAAS